MPIDSDRAVWKPVSRRPLVFLRLPALPLLLAAFFTSCTTLPQDNPLYQCNQITHIRQGMDFHPPLGNSTAKDSWDWEAIAEGIKYTSYTATQAPLRWHLVSIDLHNPRLEVLAYPDQDEINSTGTFTGKNTWSFLNKTNAAVTVNATPFKAPLTQLLPQRRLVGLYINRKSILSTPISRYSAICFWSQGDKLKAVMDVCKVGCIGCQKCAKACKFEAITMVDNLPVVDVSKCTKCGHCIETCPRKIIVDFAKV